jgi:probable rRNA maturation factor
LDQTTQFYLAEGRLSISVFSKKRRAIHGQFFGDSSPTDVITVQGDSASNFAGEITARPLFALEHNEIYGTTFEQDIKLYLVHGYFHLCGLKDKSEAEK